jgi:hypothetical protein
MVDIGNLSGSMAAKTGVAIYLHVLIVVKQGRLVAVVMALGTADESGIALLSLIMTPPAGSGLVVIFGLLVADCAVSLVKLFQFCVLEIPGLNLVPVAFFAGQRNGAEKIVMAGRTRGCILVVLAMIEKHCTCTASQVDPVGYNRFSCGHAADDNCCDCGEQCSRH